MSWQDKVLFIGNMVFLLTIIGMAIDPKTRVRRVTSISTSLILGIAAITVYTVGLRWSAYVQFGECLGWAFIAWKRRPMTAAERQQRIWELFPEANKERIRRNVERLAREQGIYPHHMEVFGADRG